MYHYIYIITNLINNKKYIGKRSTKIEIHLDSYLGSGKYLQLAIKKYKKDNFQKDILEICDSKELLNEREKYWVAYYNADTRNDFYNIVPGGQGGFRRMSEDGKRRIAEANKQRIYSEETLAKMSKSLKGKKSWNKGLKIPTGIKQTKEHINNRISKRIETLKIKGSSLIGRKYTEEHKKNMSESAKLRWQKIKATKIN